MTMLAHLERRAVHMEPRTWPSQTCLVSLLGFVSFSTYFPIRNKLQLVTLWKGPRTRVDGKLGGFAAGVWRRGRRCAFAGGSVWTSLGHLVGLTPVRNKSETQCYHDLRRPGSAVRMFMRPLNFVWAECAQHTHVNVLPGCFQISRANPKRLQLLKGGFVLETHWHRLFGPGSAGLFTWSRARGGCRMS